MKRKTLISLTLLAFMAMAVTLVYADIPGRTPPRGTVPNPGAQQQELPNITFPAPYNIFEFVVTCMACHSGTIDQSAGHGANWAGSNMASAARDPIFRANQVIVNNTIKNTTGQDGAGNICFRCHSPNGWLSGRFDPTMGGRADGSDMIQSIVLSTDTEGISCEMCHRATGSVTMKPSNINPLTGLPLYDQNDPVWNMMAGPVGEWPHAGAPYLQGPGDGNPYGDATLQFHDGMSYGGKYGGLVELSFSDLNIFDTGILGTYTGQTYGIINPFFTGFIQPPPPGMPQTNSLGELLAWNPDGSLSFQFEMAVTPDAMWGSVSPEHLTRENLFIKSPEFCGSCHDLTIPVLNHGMPEQRTYTEWKYSGYSASGTRCQDCHMPTMKHEYTDSALVSLNPDPLLAGWYPNAKDRNPYGGTTFHKMVGANRDLPQIMKILYPEVDLEVVGAPTGHDPMIFPGMLSDRGPMWDRAHRNTEISLRDGVSVQIVSPPTETATAGVYQVTVRVTNNAGHKVPSGYPDGRRMWISLDVKDAVGAMVYQSGFYDAASARLFNDDTLAGFNRALSNAIDSTAGQNAVMVYERKTGVCDPAVTSCTMSLNLLNDTILFDNRIPPAGFTYADYRVNGAAFWTYDPATFVPTEDAGRYPDGQNWDEVTYTFSAPAGQALTARAEVFYQTLPREFIEHLNDSLNALASVNPADAGPRPEGPPNPLDPNYPLTPTFLSDSLLQSTGVDFFTITDLNGNPLNDHWGGIAYAAWLMTGKGAPYLMGADDTAVAGPPAAPAAPTVVAPTDPNTGLTDPNAQVISWGAVAGADGYLVWIRYGTDTSVPNPADPFDPYPLTASWDRLAIVMAPATQITNVAMNPGKTFQYKVQAFNAKGFGPESPATVAQTPVALPLPPINTRVANVTASTVTLAWIDQADNEIGFFVERQDVQPGQPLGPWVIIAYKGSQTSMGGFGGNTWTDGVVLPPCPADVVGTIPGITGCYMPNWKALLPGRTYNYRVNAYNSAGPSGPDLPVSATTLGPPNAPSGLVATALSATQVSLNWIDNSNNETGFRIQRSTDGGVTFVQVGQVGANVNAFIDATTASGTTYTYRVVSFNANGVSAPSNAVIVTTPVAINAPSGLAATPSVLSDQPPTVTLNWTDTSANEGGFAIERAVGAGAFAEIAREGAGVTTFLDRTVGPKLTYNYRVRAFLGTSFSAYSNTATATTPGEKPEAPSNLRVIRTANNRIDLAWNDNSPNETNFLLQRATNEAFTAGLTSFTIGANATTFSDRSVARRTPYFYRIRAANADGDSAFSNTVSATTR